MGNCFGQKSVSANTRAGAAPEYVDVKGGKHESVVRSKQGVKDLKKIYNIQEKALGKGCFGKVYLATDKKDSDFKVAIKVINKSKLSSEDLKGILDEV